MSQNKISRRDALKILGATLGGAALSTIPPKWSKPALAASQLPEHAQQSVIQITGGTCGPNETNIPLGSGISRTFTLTTSPAASGLTIYYRLMPNQNLLNVTNVSIVGVGPVPSIDFYNFQYFNSATTNGAGIAQVGVTFDFVSPGGVELACNFYWDSSHRNFICTQSLFSQ